ncbi:PqqD family protein [Bacteroidota bacterium]
MRFNIFKKKESEHNYLELTPIRNHEHEDREDGMINVLVPKFSSNFSKKHINKHLKYPYIKANLDEFGTETWLLMNGKTNVKEIGQKLIDKFGEKIDPVYDRLTKFLTELHKNNFITFKELTKGK